MDLLKMNWRTFKVLQLNLHEKPKKFVDWLWLFWNFDIWVGRVPLLKLFVVFCFAGGFAGAWLAVSSS